jgi:hypothetical protein
MGAIEFERLVILAVAVAVAVDAAFLLKVLLLLYAVVAARTGVLGIVAVVSPLELELEGQDEEDIIDTSRCCCGWVSWDCWDEKTGNRTCSRDNDTLTLGAAAVVAVAVVLLLLLVLLLFFCKYNPLSETRAVHAKLGCKVGSGTALVSTPKDTK